MSEIPKGCYVWDGWLNECKSWHVPPRLQWWEYQNLWSILAMLGGVLVIAIMAFVLFMAAKELFDD